MNEENKTITEKEKENLDKILTQKIETDEDYQKLADLIDENE